MRRFMREVMPLCPQRLSFRHSAGWRARPAFPVLAVRPGRPAAARRNRSGPPIWPPLSAISSPSCRGSCERSRISGEPGARGATISSASAPIASIAWPEVSPPATTARGSFSSSRARRTSLPAPRRCARFASAAGAPLAASASAKRATAGSSGPRAVATRTLRPCRRAAMACALQLESKPSQAFGSTASAASSARTRKPPASASAICRAVVGEQDPETASSGPAGQSRGKGGASAKRPHAASAPRAHIPPLGCRPRRSEVRRAEATAARRLPPASHRRSSRWRRSAPLPDEPPRPRPGHAPRRARASRRSPSAVPSARQDDGRDRPRALAWQDGAPSPDDGRAGKGAHRRMQRRACRKSASGRWPERRRRAEPMPRQ